MDLNVLTAELSQVVAVYEVEDLAPQRAIEVILSMFNRVTEPLPALLERISALVAAWEKGEGRREKGEGRREKGEGRREKGEGRTLGRERAVYHLGLAPPGRVSVSSRFRPIR